MKVLITGAGGFTARHLIRRLRREPKYFLIGIDTHSIAPNAADLDSFYRLDLTDLDQLRQVVERTKPDWVFNLAGLTRGSAPDLYDVNLKGALNLLEVAREGYPETRVLMVGSAAEYGSWPPADMPLREDHECQPRGAYGLSKYAMTLAAQDYARNDAVKVVVVRPFNLIGAGMPASLLVGAITRRAKAALDNGETSISIGNSQTQRDFLAIEDAVNAYVDLLQAGHWGEVFNVCSGESHSVRSVIDTLLSFSRARIDVVEDEALKRENDPPIVIGDPSKMQRVCKSPPGVSFHDALHAAWNAVD